jgi:hypothetical protein
MSSPATPTPAVSIPTPAPSLSHGSAIEYRAYARQFFPNSNAAVLFLAATCFYGSSGFSISFQPTDSGFELLEQVPTGIVHELVTYYSASWNSGQQETTPPKHVTITDAFGQHRVRVEEW